MYAFLGIKITKSIGIYFPYICTSLAKIKPFT